jgi:hypothetical protein
MKQPPVSPEPISRRRMLKRIAGGAAVAWSAPILTSLSTPAFAQYACAGQCAPCFACSGGNCAAHPGAQYCAGPPGTCGPDVCLCSQTAEGDCFCGDNGTPPPPIDCVASADCPGGWRCMTICGPGQGPEARNCDPNRKACVAPCGTAQGAGAGALTFGG